MTTKGTWYDIAEYLKKAAALTERITENPGVTIELRALALEADVALMKLSLGIQAELLKNAPRLSADVPSIPHTPAIEGPKT